MATIQSLTETFGTLKRNPILFAVGLLYAVVLLPQNALQTLGIPLVPRLIQIVTFFITPFIIAGLIGMGYEGRVRGTDFGTFKKVAKDRYVPMLLANLAIFALTVVFGIALFAVLIFTVGLGIAAGGAENALASVGVVALALVGLVVLVFFVVMFFFQFFGPAIVADRVGAMEGLKRSAGVV
jgi:hypothetical protein